jgi:ADP-ribosyl-[dinitrogen reductase] hydrolase
MTENCHNTTVQCGKGAEVLGMLDRFQGSLIGLAVGDALGAAVEFKSPGSFTPVTNMMGGGVFNLPKGAWTDDTSMALCLAESLIEHNGFDARDQNGSVCKVVPRRIP